MTDEIVTSIPLKCCSRCKQQKPASLEYFAKRPCGLCAHCRACEVERVRRYREEHREAYLETNRKYSLTQKDKYRENARKRYRKYPEKQKARQRKYEESHPEVRRISSHRRRARIREAKGTYNATDIRLQIKAQTDKRGRLHCWWCSEIIINDKYHVDHRIPLSKGGSNSPENLVVSCPHCNFTKSDKLPQDFNGRLF